MRRALLLAITLTGCGPGVLDPLLDAGDATGSPGDATALDTGPPGTTSGASIPATSGAPIPGDASITSVSTGPVDDCTFVCPPTTGDDADFLVPPDDGPCDVWAQACPPGHKCAAAGPPPLDADSVVCTAIVADPAQVGEPCEVLVEGHLGPDTCDLGLHCHDVDPLSRKGTCIPICAGDPGAPACPVGQVCRTTALPLCLPACDPLLLTCPAGDTCPPRGREFDCWPVDGAAEAGPVRGARAPRPVRGRPAPWRPRRRPRLRRPGCCLPSCDLDRPGACPGLEPQRRPCSPDSPPPAGLERSGVGARP